MTPLSEEREGELITDIARQLNLSSAAQVGRVRAQCEQMREAFHSNFENEISATEKRDRLLTIEQTCLKAAEAVWRAPQDDWPPRGKFEVSGKQFELNPGSTEISNMLWALSQAAKEAAEKLVLPDAHATPEKDLTALYAWVLYNDFSEQDRQAVKDGRGYVEERWPFLSPTFRAAHSKLWEVRNEARRRYSSSLLKWLVDRETMSDVPAWVKPAQKLSPIPSPKPDRYVPPRPLRDAEAREATTTPGGPYLSIATLLFEFFTGIAGESLESSCRKVLRQYPSRRRLRSTSG